MFSKQSPDIVTKWPHSRQFLLSAAHTLHHFGLDTYLTIKCCKKPGLCVVRSAEIVHCDEICRGIFLFGSATSTGSVHDTQEELSSRRICANDGVIGQNLVGLFIWKCGCVQ